MHFGPKTKNDEANFMENEELQIVEAMYQVGRQMPATFRETAEGGLAVTPTAKRLTEKILAKQS